jgi:hypothetical protein
MPSPKSPVILAANDQPARAPLASWYAQGPSDGFGDRLLMFDNAKTGPLELLRVRPDFAAVPGFEIALRTRFDRLASFNNRGFAQARVVKHLEQGEGLTVVSNHVAGTRLSELFLATRPHPGMHPASVRAVFGDLVSSIADLHRQGRDIGHGAIAPERIVLTSERHLVVTDYVFGDALQRVKLPMERLWGEFGVVVTEDGGCQALDQRCDVVQLGLLMLSLVLGRHVSPGEYPRQLSNLLQEFTTASDRRARDVTPTLKTWLEQALDPSGFKNAVEAERAMAEPQALPRSFNVKAIDARLEDRREQPAPTPKPRAATPEPIAGPVPPAAAATRPIAPAPGAAPAGAEDGKAAADAPLAAPPAPTTLVPDIILENTSEELEPGLERELSLLRESVLDVEVKSPVVIVPPAEPVLEPPVEESANQAAFPGSILSAPSRPSTTPLRESVPRPEFASHPPLLLHRPDDEGAPAPFEPATAAQPGAEAPTSARDMFGLRAPRAIEQPAWKPVDDRASWEPPEPPPPPTSMFRWVAIALGILVLVQGAIIFRLATGGGEEPVPPPRAEAPAAVTERTAPARQGGSDSATTAATASAPSALPDAHDPPPTDAPSAAVAITRPAAAVARTPSAAGEGRTGTVRVVSPIALQVLAGDRAVGSTSEPFALAPGSHELTLVNDALNFRTQQTVRVTENRTVSVSIAPPPGAISVNASPWAQIWIDGRQVGETPLANISVPIGEHEVVFRHPQFGERRQKVLVQAGSMARASVIFTP